MQWKNAEDFELSLVCFTSKFCSFFLHLCLIFGTAQTNQNSLQSMCLSFEEAVQWHLPRELLIQLQLIPH